MRTGWLVHAPTLTVFAVFLLVAGAIGLEYNPYTQAHHPIPAVAADPFDLPAPSADRDNDTYADAVDLWEGDVVARIEVAVDGLGKDRFLLAGTDDDQWRFGAGRGLAWPHIVDPDPLGSDPGSRAWQEQAIRTGTWARTQISEGPQAVYLNIRDDAPNTTVRLELWEQRKGPDLQRWQGVVVLHEDGSWSAEGHTHPAGTPAILGDDIDIMVTPSRRALPAGEDQAHILARWAPTLHFSAEELFFPVRADVMQSFHGFATREPELRTWRPDFNNGRDAYRLLVADFDGDRDTDHDDVHLLTAILEAGNAAVPTVYGHVTYGTDDTLLVQYWFLSMYNFVGDEQGRDIAALGHAGDREFIQLRFADERAARQGEPTEVAYSQHYGGIRVQDPGPDAPHVYVALGSHASYPVPGDDTNLRPAFVGFGDTFFGDGPTWTPDDYTLEALGAQSWHAGYKWGPATRFSRDLGDAGRPLLRYDFTYPFHDGVDWARSLPVATTDLLHDLYRTPEEQR